MIIICSYCRKDMGTKEPLNDERVSHSMCDNCREHFEKQWGGLTLGEFLDRFNVPVMAVTPERRVIAANRVMAQALGKEPREIYGLLGGEVMECRYAMLPEGCGNEAHCYGCTVRQTVQHTIDTGEEHQNVQPALETRNGKIELTVSTKVKGDAVLVIVNEMKTCDINTPVITN